MATMNMPMLREWLASLAMRELESALDVFEGYNPGLGLYQQNSNGTLSCAPDNVTIYQKKTKALQIVEYVRKPNLPRQ